MPKAFSHPSTASTVKASPVLPVLAGCGSPSVGGSGTASSSGSAATSSNAISNSSTLPINASFQTIQAMLKIGPQVGSFGPELAWKIYEAQRRSSPIPEFRSGDNDTDPTVPYIYPFKSNVLMPVSLFIFEKRTAEKLHKPKRKGTITELYKRGFKQLERLHHSRFLRVVLPLEETPDALMVATEPVIGSLADVLRSDHYATGSSRIIDKLTDCPLLDLEIKCGLAQITEGLIHLHTTEHCMHANVCPESIVITANGSWKLAGMEFAEKSSDRVDSFPSIRWSSKFPKLGQPNLDFMAPEIQLDPTCSTTSDLFSLGMTICAVYNQGISLLACEHSVSVYEQKLAHLNFHAHEFVTQMPVLLRESCETLLQRNPRDRPTAQLFALTKYFNDPALTCLRRLDFIDQMFPSQKAEFYPSLAATLHSIPRKLWQSRILPALTEDLRKEDFAPYGLYAMAYMIEHSDRLDYEELYRPCVDPIFDRPDKTPETQVILLRNLSTFAKFAQPVQIPMQLLPVLEHALTSINPDVLEAGVMCFGKFYTIIRDESTKIHLFQSLKSLFGKRTDYSFKEILPTLEEQRLTYSADAAGALMGTFLKKLETRDFYRHVLKDARFGVTSDHLTRYILPTVLPLMSHPEITKEHYVSLETFIKDLVFQVERNQRLKFKLEPALMFSTVPTIPASGSNSVLPTLSQVGHGIRNYETNAPCSANNSRRSSMTSYTETSSAGKVFTNGGPYISIFTTGDNSATSSRSSSPSRSSRRSSYNSSFNSAPTGGPPEIRGRAASSSFLNVVFDDATGKSKTSMWK